MAKHLASIFRTKKDRVNCPVLLQDRSLQAWRSVLEAPHESRHYPNVTPLQHVPTPQFDQFQRRSLGSSLRPPKDSKSRRDIFEELSKYGEIESLNICDNFGSPHGNVYVQFREGKHGANALQNMHVDMNKATTGCLCIVFSVGQCLSLCDPSNSIAFTSR
ncbi:hypothetical protein U1Q18_046984 [Sarracenia purpurea var. burkii]